MPLGVQTGRNESQSYYDATDTLSTTKIGSLNISKIKHIKPPLSSISTKNDEKNKNKKLLELRESKFSEIRVENSLERNKVARDRIIECLDPKDILDYLIQENVLTCEQIEIIRNMPTPTLRAKKLIELFSGLPEHAVSQLKNILQIGHLHIFQAL